MMNTDYDRIERAIDYFDEHFRSQPGLAEVADAVGLSEFHFQRMFSRWAGVSPKRFLQFMTIGYAKQLLDESRSLLDVTYEAGLSSPSRLHDLFVSVEAVTPGEYKGRGSQLQITYGFHSTPFGEAIIGITGRGVVHLSFVVDATRRQAIDELKRRWDGATIREDSGNTQALADRIFHPSIHKGERLPLLVKGTNFQIKVWEALLRIPQGSVASYHDIASAVGIPEASRAVGTAVAQNPIAYLIPCHRVIRKSGAFGEYKWGTSRKKAMLLWETARSKNHAA
jgi:AraC family transcriptional regulator of adaptative response/methylated-DNA-[protein]-cysteine methyltransferase